MTTLECGFLKSSPHTLSLPGNSQVLTIFQSEITVFWRPWNREVSAGPRLLGQSRHRQDGRGAHRGGDDGCLAAAWETNRWGGSINGIPNECQMNSLNSTSVSSVHSCNPNLVDVFPIKNRDVSKFMVCSGKSLWKIDDFFVASPFFGNLHMIGIFQTKLGAEVSLTQWTGKSIATEPWNAG